MRKLLSLEEKLDRLRELRGQAASPETAGELTKYLSGKSNLLVAKAARVAAELGMTGLLPELLDAFQRFMLQPETTDKGCVAKTAIVDALAAMEYASPDVFLRALRHIQMEPVWGGKEDKAGDLRAAAVRAVASVATGEAVLLLRLKALVGDARPEVQGECLTELLRLAPEESLTLVLRILDTGEPAVSEAAALAFGEARPAGALATLRERLDTRPDLRRALLLAIAMLRSEQALEFLLSLPAADRDLRNALALYKDDERVRERLGY